MCPGCDPPAEYFSALLSPKLLHSLACKVAVPSIRLQQHFLMHILSIHQ
jgi:hypothetical protein